MGHLRYVTLTGVDERTDFDELKRLSGDWHFVEWGVLYDPARAGKGGRYPSLEWLEAFATRANEAGLTIALHLCGQAVKTLLKSVESRQPATPDAQRLFGLAEKFGRVQLNTRAKLSDEQVFRDLVSRLSRNENRTRVILQWNSANEDLCRRLAMENAFEVLVDSSGGRGVERDDWPCLEQHHLRRVGYAGGLGPENIARQLPMMAAAAAGRSFWADMESKLRDDADNFVPALCEQVLAAAWAFVLQQERELGTVWGSGMRDVATLEGLWLDWWVGVVRNKDLVIPPLDACRAVTLYRPTGSFEGYTPSEDLGLALRILSAERIALTPTDDDQWRAQADTADVPAMLAAELHIAGLRAVVAKHYGTQVPVNPADL